MRTCSLLIAGIVSLWLPGTALAADAAVPVVRQVERVEPAACLRWVWQQYSWYDDCWAARHPYIGGRVVARIPRH